MAQVLPSGPLCLAHRGASAAEPENTARAFSRAMALGADGVELDVRATRDGVPVVFHDPSLARLAGIPGRIDRLTWPELQRVSIGGERIPHLAEALEIVAGRGIVQIELKAAAALAPVLRTVRRNRAADSVILASFDPGMVRAAAAAAPKLLRMLICDAPQEGALALLRRMAAAGAHGVSLDYRAVKSRAFVEIFRRRGVTLWCWTVDRPADMRRLAGYGVNALLTNDPAAMRNTL